MHPDDGFYCSYLGVAIDSNSGKGGEGRDGCAAVILALRVDTVVIVEWDIQSLAQGGVPAWLDHVRGMAMNWFYRLKPAHGFS
jgi:hypothetical protein